VGLSLTMPSEGWGCDDDVLTVTEDNVCSVLLCRRREDPPNQEAGPRSPGTPHSPQRSWRPPIVFSAVIDEGMRGV
jgi:hypothetical protein